MRTSVRVIAEVAGGHMGKLDRCIQLVRAAGEAGADIVKFQFYNAVELVAPTHPDFNLFLELQFAPAQWTEIFAVARSFKMQVYADVFGRLSFQEANLHGVDGFKLHSADTDNQSLLRLIAETGKPLLLGVGGHKRIEIYETLKYYRSFAPKGEVTLMPGHQLFPTPLAEHSLAEIRWLADAYREFGVTVGCADHVDGDDPAAQLFPIAAIGAGAVIIEKHLTINRTDKWEDYESAIESSAFSELVARVRMLTVTTQEYPLWTAGRESYRRKALKAPFSAKNLTQGSVPSEYEINFVRPTEYREPLSQGTALHRTLSNSIPAGKFLTAYDFNQSVGIIVNARMASQRLPHKATRKICGRETVALLLERMRHCRGAAGVVLATTENKEDDVLVELAKREGIEVFRGPDINVALRLQMAAKQYGFDHIVRVTGDDLLRDIPMIETAIANHLEANADYTAMDGMVYSCDTEIISYRALATVVERARKSENTEYLTWYLDDQSAFVQNRIRVPEVYSKPYRLTLDTESDFQVLNAIYEALYLPGKPVDLKEALKFLDQHPEIAALNAAITPKLTRQQLDLRVDI